MTAGRLTGRTAVVVGVGASIGSAVAALFANEGAQLVLVDSDPAATEAVAESITRAGGIATVVHADVSSDAGSAAVRDVCESLPAPPDVLFVGMASMDTWPVADDTLERWDDVFRTNLWGPIAITRALMPLLERSGHSSVIYLGSVDGLLANANVPAYSISKGGLVPLTHVVALQGGPHGVRANCIATAGIVQTPPTAPAPERELSGPGLVGLTPLGRTATPDDIAPVALFFASDDSRYVTGTVLPVDGGRLAVTPGTQLSAPTAPT